MKFSYISFIFLFVKIVLSFSLVYSLEEVFPGSRHCYKIVRNQVSRRVPYQETFRRKIFGIFYKTEWRWNYRIAYDIQLQKETVCCKGYLEKGRNLFTDIPECQPECPNTCIHGSCIRPNECICDSGYSNPKDLMFDSLCVPVCFPPCVHGKCTAPNVCTCDRGYSLNAVNTHVCEPVCTLPCLEGSYCSKPDYCDCLNGYIIQVQNGTLAVANANQTRTCVPVCEKDCVHGKCTAPDICTCDHGYKPDPYDAFVCIPECEHGCTFGTCTAPNVCTCEHGYALKSPSMCEPVCSNDCVMGICVAPESCSCFTGYALEDSKYVCVPICEKICLNGECTEPGVCTCNEGFRLSEDESEKHVCKPYCEIPCEPFGVCTAPNVCTCFEGYRLSNNTQTEKSDAQHFSPFAIPNNSACEPICDPMCVNGFCSAPNTCKCYYGYDPSDGNANICNPICSHCLNAFCSAPETCTCHEGYRPLRRNVSTLLSSFVLASSSVCVPACKSDCVNGRCVAPNKCTCNLGYRPTEGNRTDLCEPNCNFKCKNGICVKPNKCACNPGYNQSRSNKCEPICHPACGKNEICEGPDRCVCENGYREVYHDDRDAPFECAPICSVDCGNGTCTAPEVCTCHDGYRNAETGRCEPVCSMCDNGTCVAPDICECDDGFVLRDSGIDVRIKESQFEGRQDNRSKCIPHCESCDNGECVAPGECRCYAGFVEIEGTCVHACQGGCGAHGKCIDERRICECNYGWRGLHCDQPTLCISILSDVENRTDQLNVIEQRNSTIEQVFTSSPMCSECIDKINNETLCFKMHTTDIVNDTQIGCLISAECIALSIQYRNQNKILRWNYLSGMAGVGILFLLGTAITTYVLLRKRQNEEIGDEQISDQHSASMQGLLEQNTNDL